MSTSSLLGSLLNSSQSSSSSSSSIDLSSLLQAMTGASTPGIDVTSAVAAAVYAARAPERVWQADQTTLSSQTTDLTSLSTAVSNLESDLNALNDPMGAINSLSLTSSDSSIVSGTATSGAVAGTHTIEVNNLVQTGSWYSDSVASGATLSAGTFDIASGGNTTQVSVSSGETVAQLAQNINGLTDANGNSLGVTASVMTDSSGLRLAIVSNNPGSAGDFSISNVSTVPSQSGGSATPFLGFTQAEQGKDASISVDGVPYTSTSNTITGALSGVTLNLASASPGTQVSITTAPDASDVGSAIQSFVSDYNSIITTLNSQFAYSATSSSTGDLADDSVVRSLQSELLGAMSTIVPNNGSISTLGSMGISMNNDGTLTIDSTTLNSALTNNFSAVQNFFQGGALNGFASQLSNQLNAFTDPTDGAFTVDLQSLSSENTDLQNSD